MYSFRVCKCLVPVWWFWFQKQMQHSQNVAEVRQLTLWAVGTPPVQEVAVPGPESFPSITISSIRTHTSKDGGYLCTKYKTQIKPQCGKLQRQRLTALAPPHLKWLQQSDAPVFPLTASTPSKMLLISHPGTARQP